MTARVTSLRAYGSGLLLVSESPDASTARFERLMRTRSESDVRLTKADTPFRDISEAPADAQRRPARDDRIATPRTDRPATNIPCWPHTAGC